jgi:mannose-1-phosphate guanylyltransferase/mannose-6-phosphate isomerase
MDGAAFTEALQRSVRAAVDGSIVILGVNPDRPETGYGYIKHQGLPGANGEYSVAQFAEKPDLETAARYVDSCNYAWNSGIFVLRASVWLKALAQLSPAVLSKTHNSFSKRSVDAQFVRPDQEAFTHVPSDSVDYAVLEKCPGSDFVIKMVPLKAGWNDLGAWDAVWQMSTQDNAGNVTHGDTLMANTTNTFIHASSRLVGAVGVNNLIVVETADAILVADKSQCQHLKKIVGELVALKRAEHILPRKVHRPWGWYDSIDEGARFKVKRIQVKPGASLSLQRHQQRAEHWVVVRGMAEVTCGEKTLILTENQSTYIPLGEMHRLSNPGTIPLEIIEVQFGDYLGEDDIERFDDAYGRR